ncbi:MAG: metallophosphoesterase [Betaproteobacteria bacterium]|nr:metallophosphoesterase [Betaproteobacteria bacterium]
MRIRATWAWGVGAGVLLASLAFYSLNVEPDWVEVTTHTFGVGQVDGSNGKIRIIQISDLHLHGVAERDERLAKQIRELNADAVVFTGDIIDRAENLELLASFLSALGPTPRIAVLGNWEYWSKVDLKRLRAIYESAPQSLLLVNQKANVMLKGREIEFIGLDDFTAGKPDTRLLRSQTSSIVRVVLQHSPGLYEEPDLPVAPQNQICLSGHTHGGQVTLFGRPFWTPRGSGRFLAGWYETPSCRLYVSRGVGMSILPIRFGARPEVAVFEL